MSSLYVIQGGLPAWLLNKKNIVLRSTDAGKAELNKMSYSKI